MAVRQHLREPLEGQHNHVVFPDKDPRGTCWDKMGAHGRFVHFLSLDEREFLWQFALQPWCMGAVEVAFFSGAHLEFVLACDALLFSFGVCRAFGVGLSSCCCLRAPTFRRQHALLGAVYIRSLPSPHSDTEMG